MKSSSLFSIIVSVAFTLGTISSVSADPIHWSYTGESGPAKWSALSPEFSACNGKNQSPVNLTGFISAELEDIKFQYSPGATEILNNGHAIQVNYAAGSSMVIDSTEFLLKQFHFHTPSENHLNGTSYPIEVHLVHSDKDGNLAVVAVLFAAGLENQLITELWNHMPTEAGTQNALPKAVNAADLLPADRDYYRFNGSLTTPPCTEGVRWFVMSTPVTASKDQIVKLESTLGHPNNRPIQRLNARVILE